MAVGALEGIKVVEFGELISAPYCGKLFADYGADVLKVERSPEGDPARSWGPFPDDQPDTFTSSSPVCPETSMIGKSIIKRLGAAKCAVSFLKACEIM